MLMTVLRGNVREPNVPATQIEIHDGLQVLSQNRNPSLAFDISAVNQLGGKLIGAGFYYKTFMGPVVGPLKGTRFWMFCENSFAGRPGSGMPDASRICAL
jgi:sarcosine oxidase subunit alpha